MGRRRRWNFSTSSDRQHGPGAGVEKEPRRRPPVVGPLAIRAFRLGRAPCPTNVLTVVRDRHRGNSRVREIVWSGRLAGRGAGLRLAGGGATAGGTVGGSPPCAPHLIRQDWNH